jgi:hypothetical protein
LWSGLAGPEIISRIPFNVTRYNQRHDQIIPLQRHRCFIRRQCRTTLTCASATGGIAQTGYTRSGGQC